MSDELDIRVKAIVEADEAASAKRIKAQMPGIESAIKDKPIKVPVEMQESSSAKNIKGQIKNLEAALKSKSLKIQLGVDIAASMRAIKSAIPTIQDAFKGNPVKIPFVFDPKGAAKAAQQAAKAAQQAAEKATSSSKGGKSLLGSDDYQMRILKKRMEGLQYAESKAGLPSKLDWAGFNEAFNVGDIKAARSEFRLLTLEFSNLNQQVRGGLDSQLKNLPQRISSAATAASDLAKKFSSIKIQGGIIPDDALSRIQALKTKLQEFENTKPEGADAHAYLETFRELEGELLKIKEVYKDTVGTFRKQKIEIGADKLKVDIANVQKNLQLMKTNWSAFMQNPELLARWNQLFDASKVDMTAAEVRKLSAEVQGLGKDIQVAGLAHKNLWGQITSNFQKFSMWLGIGNIFMSAVNGIRDMVSAVKAIDNSMVSLKKVTNETEATYSKFLKGASRDAITLGTSISNLVDATSTFSRLGYALPDATELGRVATLYFNVADGISSIDEASQDIVSSMKAYGIQASDALGIVDRLNRVGNEFSISSGGLGDALRRSASALAEANNDINQSIALNTAANNVVQDPEKVGGLRLVA